MTKGSSTLRYNLYTSATHATIWGDGTGETAPRGGNLLGGNFTVYGRIPARQNVLVGTYSDMITVTVDY
jgi:spore coat protein U-like protein